jgi:glucose-6-phosphate isomerase
MSGTVATQNLLGIRGSSGTETPVEIDWLSGRLAGPSVRQSRKTLGELRGLFAGGETSELPPETELYNVAWFGTRDTGAEGALLFGCTRLHPGTVGDEYFMTHGHFHANRTRDELYFPVSGTGLLLRQEQGSRCWAEEMHPGGILSISGAHAHRVVNTGDDALVFWASWPADAGYDYASIAKSGFGLRVFRQDEKPVIVPCEQPE